MSVFVINSLYWMLLCTHGQKPKENEVLQNEINRTKEYMGRLKQLEERKAAPCLNQRAAKSFVRNALWEPKQQQRSGTSNVSLLILLDITMVKLLGLMHMSIVTICVVFN
ncbi:hypothetical protein WUBG_17639 [Wuchereria bancrofti]|uniref:Nuclear nucleic acid-binding protein C1D n=1 Tax=Wuchereria bancrofti TaxID=6293 RepID=J9DP93_WUCBA|nr:hypothetical protein WUBG_17639 [Wuchereria bancrofti]